MGPTRFTPPTVALTLAILLLPSSAAAQEGAERLWGRVSTAAGETYEGWIRWDRNEGSWADVLNGSKALPREHAREAEELGVKTPEERQRSVEFLGIRVSWEEDDDYPAEAESGIRFGHIRTLRVLSDDAALLTLKGGEEVELSGGSTDLGTNLRGFEVDDPQRGPVELRWRDLDVVEFRPAPASARTGPAARLHGTVEDRWGNRYTGWVAWDLDEILTTDELDGKEGGRDRAVPFGRIAAIERESSSSARVTLVDGQEMVLSGTNDVDSSNRGIQVADPELGQVQLGWDAFSSLRLHAPERSGGYGAFDGGHRLYGTVETENGGRHTGWIRWDNDESWSWELLDGNVRGVAFDVELGAVARIEKASTRSSAVTLRDGRTFELEGSNDVDRGNKGVFVTGDDGSTVAVRWRDFHAVTFAAPGR